MSGSSSRTNTSNNYETTNESLTLGQEGQGHVAVTGDGNTLQIQRLDGQVVGDALNFGRDALDISAGALLDSANAINQAFDRAASTNELAMMNNSEMALSVAQQSSDMLNDSLNFADNQSSKFTDALTNTVSDSLNFANNQNNLAFNTISDVVNDSNALIDSQNQRTTNAMADTVTGSLNFADSQNQLLANALADNGALTQQALIEMGVMQERSLNSALDVANSVAIDDNAEFATDSIKWISGAVMVIGVAMMMITRRF